MSWRDKQFYSSERGLWVLPAGVADEEIRRLKTELDEARAALRACDEAIEGLYVMAGNGVLCEPFNPVTEPDCCDHCKRLWAAADEAQKLARALSQPSEGE